MKRFFSAVLFLGLAVCAADARGMTDAQVRSDMIRQSISYYPRSCACPFSHTPKGKVCGKDSDYVQLGGHSRLCYASDITPEMLTQYRDFHGLR